MPAGCRMRSSPSAPNPPQLAGLLQRCLHPFDRGRIGLRAAAPAQGVANLIERNFPAHRPIQNVRSDLADSLRRFPVSLPMEELNLRLRHSREVPEVGCKYAAEVGRSQLVGEPGVIPVMAVFLPGGILLRRDDVACEGALQRAVA